MDGQDGFGAIAGKMVMIAALNALYYVVFAGLIGGGIWLLLAIFDTVTGRETRKGWSSWLKSMRPSHAPPKEGSAEPAPAADGWVDGRKSA